MVRGINSGIKAAEITPPIYMRTEVVSLINMLNKTVSIALIANILSVTEKKNITPSNKPCEYVV